MASRQASTDFAYGTITMKVHVSPMRGPEPDVMLLDSITINLLGELASSLIPSFDSFIRMLELKESAAPIESFVRPNFEIDNFDVSLDVTTAFTVDIDPVVAGTIVQTAFLPAAMSAIMTVVGQFAQSAAMESSGYGPKVEAKMKEQASLDGGQSTGKELELESSGIGQYL